MGWMDITDKQKPLGKKVNPGMFAIESTRFTLPGCKLGS